MNACLTSCDRGLHLVNPSMVCSLRFEVRRTSASARPDSNTIGARQALFVPNVHDAVMAGRAAIS